MVNAGSTNAGDIGNPRLEITYATTPKSCDDVIASGFVLSNDTNHDCVVDMQDMNSLVEEWLSCTTPGGVGCVDGDVVVPTGKIALGTAVVDGDISEWTNVEWVPIDVNIYGNPTDITEAKMAMRWDAATDKIYAAVVVTDTIHWFEDGYVDWDAADSIEVFSQGDAAGGEYNTNISDIAQQYFIGSNISEDGYWATWAQGNPIYGSNLETAVSVNGDNIIYELGVQMYDNFAGRAGATGSTVISQLETGKIVRFDVVVDTRSGVNTSDFGVIATTNAENRAVNADNIAQYELVQNIPCGGFGYLKGDITRDCIINFKDFSILAEDWLICNDPAGDNCIENW
jgi:hypothetical protein